MYCKTVLTPDFGGWGAARVLSLPFELIVSDDDWSAVDGDREDFGDRARVQQPPDVYSDRT